MFPLRAADSSSEATTMPLDALNCNQCGAPLSVPAEANFVTCHGCGQSLAILRNETVSYTQARVALEQKTASLSKEVAHLRYQQAAAELDRAWAEERRELADSDRDGRIVIPSRGWSLFCGVFIVGSGLFVMGHAAINLDTTFVLFGVGLLFAGVLAGCWGCFKATAYEQAEAEYRRQKSQLTVESFKLSEGSTELPKDLPWTS